MFNPSFIKLATTAETANNFGASIDNANPDRTWLHLCPGEVYNQYVLFNQSLAQKIFAESISRVSLQVVGKGVVDANIGYGYRYYPEYNAVLFSFKINEDYKESCLRLQIAVGAPGGGRSFLLFSNLFTCTEYNRETSSLVTYRHLENHYGIPYNIPGRQAQAIWNQIRLPFYYLKNKTEQDSKENIYSVNTPTNIQIGRVNRKNLKIWQVIANDWMNERIGIISDTDRVYINGQREATRPYEYEEVTNGSDFSLSTLESQQVYGDTYMDEFGLVNHRPVIRDIKMDEPCCDPSGKLTEPTITTETTEVSDCEFDGIQKLITITGEPNATIKYRLSATSILGTSKEVRVYNGDINNTHIFNSAEDVFIGFAFLNNSGTTQIRIKCCLEDCTPGHPIEIDANFELYKMNGTELTGSICNIQKSKTCVLPPSAQWVIISESGTREKKVKIIGNPNTTIQVRAEVLSANPGGLYTRLQMAPILDVSEVNTGDFWDLNIALNSSGESSEYDIRATAGNIFTIGERTLYASFRIYDYDGNPSPNVVGVYHIDY